MEDKKESYIYKINKSYMVVANNVSEAETVFKKHCSNVTITELKRVGTVLM